jgi:tetratricopeptide (TPR) repeat protein
MLQRYCRALAAAGREREASAVHRGALATSRALFGDHHAHTLRDMQVAAESSHTAGELDDAAALYTEVGAQLKDTLGRFHPRTVHALRQHARLCMEAGLLAQAERLSEEVVSGYKEVIGGAWAQRQHWHNLVDALNILADLRLRAGRHAEAEALLRDALATSRNRAVPKPAVGGVRSWSEESVERSSAYQLMRVLGLRRCFDGALALMQQLLCAQRSQLRSWTTRSADVTPQVVASLRELLQLQCCSGALLQGAGRYEEALDAYEQSLSSPYFCNSLCKVLRCCVASHPSPAFSGRA